MTEEMDFAEGLVLLRAKFNEERERCKNASAGQPNTPGVLTRKGHALATMVVACAQHSYWSLTEVVGELDKRLGAEPPTREHFARMFYEWVWLYIHLIDRIAFDLIGPKKRSALVNALVERTVEILRDAAEEESPKLKQMAEPKVIKAGLMDSFWENLNVRQQEYAKFAKWLPDDKEGYGGTLFWEFAAKLARVVGRERDLNVVSPIQAGVGHPMTLELLGAARGILPE